MPSTWTRHDFLYRFPQVLDVLFSFLNVSSVKEESTSVLFFSPGATKMLGHQDGGAVILHGLRDVFLWPACLAEGSLCLFFALSGVTQSKRGGW